MKCLLQVQIIFYLNEKNTAKFHIYKNSHNIITIQFTEFSLAKEKNHYVHTILAYICVHANSVLSRTTLFERSYPEIGSTKTFIGA